MKKLILSLCSLAAVVLCTPAHAVVTYSFDCISNIEPSDPTDAAIGEAQAFVDIEYFGSYIDGDGDTITQVLFTFNNIGPEDSSITDAGMAYVARIETLRELDLPSAITNTGLAQLSNLTKLQELDLSYTKITDAGLTHLKNMAELGTLYLTQTEVSDSGLEHLTRLSCCFDANGKRVSELRRAFH